MLDDHATFVSICDEGGGEFVRIVQPATTNGPGEIGFSSRAEWQAISSLVDDCFDQIAFHAPDSQSNDPA
jgi:hypothetical protein